METLAKTLLFVFLDMIDACSFITDSLGQWDKALDYYQNALPILEEVGDRVGLIDTLNNIGMLYANWGQPNKALDHYRYALAICEKLDERPSLATTLNNIGCVYAALGQSTNQEARIRGQFQHFGFSRTFNNKALTNSLFFKYISRPSAKTALVSGSLQHRPKETVLGALGDESHRFLTCVRMYAPKGRRFLTCVVSESYGTGFILLTALKERQSVASVALTLHACPSPDFGAGMRCSAAIGRLTELISILFEPFSDEQGGSNKKSSTDVKKEVEDFIDSGKERDQLAQIFISQTKRLIDKWEDSLFNCYDVPALPPNNAALESRFNLLRRGQRRISGRQKTSQLRRTAHLQLLLNASSVSCLYEQLCQVPPNDYLKARAIK